MTHFLRQFRDKLRALTARGPDQTEVWLRDLEQMEADNPQWARECRVREARAALQSGLPMKTLLCAFSKDVLEEASRPTRETSNSASEPSAGVESPKPSLD